MSRNISYKLRMIFNTMSLTPIKYRKKYLFSYKAASNNIHQLDVYAHDAYD